MRLLTDWTRYGYCTSCNTYAQERCNGKFRFLPCKGRESYEQYLRRYALILSEHHGYTILPEEVYKYE